MNEAARARVERERRLRYPSARAAATAGEISNTLWSRFEKDGNVTDAVRAGVARAFDWPMSWPEQLPPEVEPRPDELTQLRDDHAALSDEVNRLRGELAALRATVLGLEDVFLERMQAVEARTSIDDRSTPDDLPGGAAEPRRP
jgi:hypothetical protein